MTGFRVSEPLSQGLRVCGRYFTVVDALKRTAGVMDSRRRSAVIGPRVRQVGFVTPNADIPGEGSGMGSEKEAVNLTANSPTPVTIVPMRPVIDIPQKAEPIAVPLPSPRRPIDVEIPSAPTGSYNPADPVLEGSSLPSSKGGLSIYLSA